MSPTTHAPPYPQSPTIGKSEALLCLVLNVIAPGIGTIAGGVLGKQRLVARGIAQLLLSIILIGWIWAVVTGVQMVHNATWRETPITPTV